MSIGSFDELTPQQRAQELFRRRKAVEEELSRQFDVLREHRVDMNTSLLDNEGFPRADFDIVPIRTARAAIIRLRNDYASLSQQMEAIVLEGLPSLAPSIASSAVATQSTQQSQNVVSTSDGETLTPIAKFDSVHPAGPAGLAGLQRNDLLVAFGSVNSSSSDVIKAIANLVAVSEGSPITTRVIRDFQGNTQSLSLTLTPKRNWGGRGQLGCHIVPL